MQQGSRVRATAGGADRTDGAPSCLSRHRAQLRGGWQQHQINSRKKTEGKGTSNDVKLLL